MKTATRRTPEEAALYRRKTALAIALGKSMDAARKAGYSREAMAEKAERDAHLMRQHGFSD